MGRHLQFRDELWKEFDKTIKSGAKFSKSVFTTYPRGQIIKGLMKTTDGLCGFNAYEIIANPAYIMHNGVDLIGLTGKVTFVDFGGRHHTIEPDILDIYWLCEILDARIL